MIQQANTSATASDIFNGMTTFYEVVRSESFTRTAELLGCSTSYISKEVSKLEARLGVRLLNRTTRRLSLTPEGRVYYQRCKQIIEDTTELEREISGHQLEPQGVLKISCPVTFGLSKLRPVLAEFMALYPKIELDIDLSDKKVDVIAEGFDAVIRASSTLQDSTLISRKIISTHIVTVASPAYLEEFGNPQHPSQLTDHQILNYKYTGSDVWHFESELGEKVSVPIKNKVITNSPELELALCAGGHGISRQPMFNFGDELDSGAVVRILQDYLPQPLNVYVLYPSRKHMSAKVRCFIDFVADKFGNTQ